MRRSAQSSWIGPDGQVYPLGGKSHTEFAYDILFNEKLGEHMSKKLPTDGSTEQKGKSGEVAAADAHKELGGNPSDPRHAEELCNRGWTQASDDGERMVVRATGYDSLRVSLPCLAELFGQRDVVVFSICGSGSRVSAGLCGKELLGPVELVLGRISEAASGKVHDRSNSEWSSQGYGIRYFE